MTEWENIQINHIQNISIHTTANIDTKRQEESKNDGVHLSSLPSGNNLDFITRLWLIKKKQKTKTHQEAIMNYSHQSNQKFKMNTFQTGEGTKEGEGEVTLRMAETTGNHFLYLPVYNVYMCVRVCTYV